MVIVCPKCRALNPDGFLFCGRCGKPLREEKEPGKEPEEIPSWLKELGEGLAAGPGPAIRAGGGEEPPPWLEEGPAEEKATPEGLPPWLAEEAAPAEEAAGELPPWLVEEGAPIEGPAAEEMGVAGPVVGPEEGAGAGLPPWLAEEAAPAEEGPAGEEMPVAGAPRPEEEEARAVPEEPVRAPEPWLEGLEEELPAWLAMAETEKREAEVFPSWPGAPEAAAERPTTPAEEAEIPAVTAEPVPSGAAGEAGLPAGWGQEAGQVAMEAETWEEGVGPPAEEAAEAAPAHVEEGGPGEEAGLPAVPTEGATPLPEVPHGEFPEVEVSAEEAGPAPWLPHVPEAEGERVPDWARALQPQESAQASFLEGLELPDWLRVEEERVEEVPAEPTLSWLERLGEEEEVKPAPVGTTARPPLPPLSPARRRAADLFAALVAAPEPVPQERPSPAPSLLKRFFRWLSGRWPGLFLLGVLLVGWVLPSSPPEIAQENWSVLERIDQVLRSTAGEDPPLVLVAFDWDLHRAGEMHPLGTALMRHLLRPIDPQRDPRKRPAVVAVSTTFQGGYIAQEVWESARDASGYEGVAYGTDFLNLAMRPGGESALRLLTSQPVSATFPVDHLFGQPVEYYALGKRLGRLEGIDLLVVMAGEESKAVAWLEQVRSRYPHLPCVLIAPAELRPVLEPYMQARGISPDGALWGLRAAFEYEDWLNRMSGIVVHRDLPLEKRLNVLAVAQLGLVALVVLGNLLPLGGGMEGSGR